MSSHNYTQSDLDIVLGCREIIRDPAFLEMPKSLNQLDINGNDLISIGYKPGKFIGETLNKLMEIILDNPHLNNKPYLMSKANKILQKNKQ